jgi:hypothetical protein
MQQVLVYDMTKPILEWSHKEHWPCAEHLMVMSNDTQYLAVWEDGKCKIKNNDEPLHLFALVCDMEVQYIPTWCYKVSLETIRNTDSHPMFLYEFVENFYINKKTPKILAAIRSLGFDPQEYI